MNSAQMTLIHPALTPARIPVNSSGMAAGTVIFRNSEKREAPKLLAAL